MPSPTLFFIGVTTNGSSIMRIFPDWMRELGRPDVVIEGMDFPPNDAPAAYRGAVERIKRDPLALGALVTTHKLSVVAAAGDLFDEFDPFARLCGEVSCLSKRDGRLLGHALDPITGGMCLDAMLGAGYFGRTGGEVLCLGCGGAAIALATCLARRSAAADRPRRFVAVDRVPGRLKSLRRLAEVLGSDIEFEYLCHDDARRNDERMADLPPASLVINATGMGKDLPGSPLTGEAVFPRGGIAWELNYRGELGFLHQARRQGESRGLRVEDGWLYFLHGWTQVIAQVLQVDVGGAVFERLAALARL